MVILTDIQLTIDPQMLEDRAFSPSSEVRMQVAENPFTPPETLEMLSNDPYILVQLNALNNPSFPYNALVEKYRKAKNISYLRTAILKTALAKHDDTTGRMLSMLSYSEDSHLRELVAMHPHATARTLERLAGDFHSRVRMRVAENPNASTGTLLSLFFDSDEDVREAAETSLLKRKRK